MGDNSKNKLYCTSCGKEINPDDKFCSGCGNSVIEKKDETTSSNKISSKSKVGKKSNSNNEFHKTRKEISTVKIVYLLAALAFISVLMIYAAGVFDQPEVTSNNSNSKADVHNEVDLQHLQEINSLEETVKNNPNDKTSLLELAHLLNDSGFKERAIEKYKTYLKIDPQNADVLVDMGVCYYELGKYDDAIGKMKEALQYQPRHQIAHLNLGIVNLTAGKHDEAITWWKKAVEINPATEIAKRAQEFINSH